MDSITPIISYQPLLDIAGRYAAETGVAETAVSWRVFNDNRVLSGLRSGDRTITVSRYNMALIWFAQNWPAKAAIPDDLAALRRQIVAVAHAGKIGSEAVSQ